MYRTLSAIGRTSSVGIPPLFEPPPPPIDASELLRSRVQYLSACDALATWFLLPEVAGVCLTDAARLSELHHCSLRDRDERRQDLDARTERGLDGPFIGLNEARRLVSVDGRRLVQKPDDNPRRAARERD